MARFALSVILFGLAASTVAAQEAVPETPPELRDFRLDPERAPPEPQPQAEVQPPPVVRIIEPDAQNSAPPSERPAPVEPRQTRRQADTAGVAETADDPGEPSREAIAAPPTVNVPAPSASTETLDEAAPLQVVAPSMPWWQIIAALFMVVVALLGGWLYARRRRAHVAEAEGLRPIAPATTPVIVPEAPIAAAIEKPAPRPRIVLEFIPDKATLGFTALTVKGQIRLINQGDAPANDMQLRATMVSANQRHKETIAAFHGGAIPIEPNPLGTAKAGERIALDIEMSVQVNDLDSYNVGDRKIFAPVMLANLAYAWEGGTDNVTIACMIGRETDPPQPRMGPLRLDLGPRSFSPLGQRPIYA